MVFDTFRIQLRGPAGNAQRLQKGNDDLMPLLAFRSELAADVGQENSAVGLVFT